jgi:hypothetical protein
VTGDAILKLLGAVVALGTFVWGIWTYSDTSKRQLAREEREAARLAETRSIEARRPFLERQLALYSEVTKVAATLAISDVPADRAKARQRLLELYHGELALVENRAVANAMIEIKRCLEAGPDCRDLPSRALALAHACRDSLARSWRTDAWLMGADDKP